MDQEKNRRKKLTSFQPSVIGIPDTSNVFQFYRASKRLRYPFYRLIELMIPFACLIVISFKHYARIHAVRALSIGEQYHWYF